MQPATDYPDFVARFYDVIYGQLRMTDRSYFVRKVLDTRGPVLEIGVGTGRLFLDALSRGADIDGIDSSASMLAKLKEKLHPAEHQRIALQDVRTMLLPRTYDLIVAPFRVFSHLIDTEDQLNALESVHTHLNQHGTFIFDLFVPDLNILVKGIDHEVDFDGEYEPGKRLRRTVSAKADLLNQINLVTMTYEWDEDGRTRSETWQTRLRYYFRYELEHLVRRTRLTSKRVYGDYQEHELSPDSKDFVVVCERAD